MEHVGVSRMPPPYSNACLDDSLTPTEEEREELEQFAPDFFSPLRMND